MEFLGQRAYVLWFIDIFQVALHADFVNSHSHQKCLRISILYIFANIVHKLLNSKKHID